MLRHFALGPPASAIDLNASTIPPGKGLLMPDTLAAALSQLIGEPARVLTAPVVPGYAITYANNQMETSYLFALMFTATLLGFSFFFIVMFVESLALPNWHEPSRPQTAE
jgi:hypothetical protein